jgi:hypothetical protein
MRQSRFRHTGRSTNYQGAEYQHPGPSYPLPEHMLQIQGFRYSGSQPAAAVAVAVKNSCDIETDYNSGQDDSA